ncbi:MULTISPECIES: hypothetical protein [unclassified Isoptericola]|uniref:hypothetical protein n=1 Tax=unclassified Isoptericola TaxID=2623355 RepID=UPI003648F479
MRNRQTMTRASALAASALLALGLAACSSGDGDGSTDGSTTAAESQETPQEEDAAAAGGDFCDAVQALTDASSAMGDVDPSDLQPTVDKLDELTTTMEGVTEPPAEVADDWTTLTTAFRTATDGIETAAKDPTDADSMSQLQDAMTAMTSSEFTDAAKSVGTYAGTNC